MQTSLVPRIAACNVGITESAIEFFVDMVTGPVVRLDKICSLDRCFVVVGWCPLPSFVSCKFSLLHKDVDDISNGGNIDERNVASFITSRPIKDATVTVDAVATRTLRGGALM